MLTGRRFILLAALMLALVACSPKPLIVSQIADLADKGTVALERDDDLVLTEKALPANIKLLESVLANAPEDRQLLTLLSRLYGSYAFGFVETRLEERLYRPPSSEIYPHDRESLKKQVNRYYQKGVDYALQALENSLPGAADAFLKVDTIEPYLAQLGRRDVGPLFWYGFNLGAWVNRNLDSMRAVSRAHVARRIMQRVIDLDPAYHHGGAHLFLLVYFGSRPPMMGGSPELARNHYQMLKQIVGDDYLLSDLFYARYCIRQQQDRQAFVAAMQRIIDHPTAGSDVALYNAIAVRRAVIYLSAVDVWFD